MKTSILFAIWRTQPGRFFCLSTKDGQRFRDKFFSSAELDKCSEFIRAHSACDIYWSVNGYEAEGRAKENALRGRCLYADLDEVDPRELEPRATFAWETSPGRHQAIWMCNSLVSDGLNKCLVYRTGADKDSWARNKILRVPGTWNYNPKYKTPSRVKLMWRDGPSYSLAEIECALKYKQWLTAQRHHDVNRADEVLGMENASVRELMRRFRVKSMDMGRAGKRHRAIYRIWKTMIVNGASLPVIIKVLEASWSWPSKIEEHGDGWGEAELVRIRRAIDEAR